MWNTWRENAVVMESPLKSLVTTALPRWNWKIVVWPLLLPSGLMSSYKGPMWHGGKVELLHTSVSEGQDRDAVAQVGVSLAFNCQADSIHSRSFDSSATDATNACSRIGRIKYLQ
ncbi:putative NDH-dependent cyclic electron flow 5 [Quillaja saponaria]|uniref:NDH-dependent cyclic electron flow 5 n=1 Tax=Quillaja saponaria TaxID=32244 RepID=A0AAD7PZ76_QUISA|nr:putative NDH-dependent cyclic electron flow 5 [Quillaja saponaria]